MKKRTSSFLVLLFVVASFHVVKAQDFIYLKNKQARIAVEDISVLSSETRYQLFGDQSNVTYAINNADISLIAYANGDIRLFQGEGDIKPAYKYEKNLFTFHLFDLVVNQFTLSYERILSNGKVGLQIPVSLGFSESDHNGFDDVNNKYYTGINLNFYPTGQGKVRYFLGPGLQVGQSTYNEDQLINGQYIDVEVETMSLHLLVNNGLMISPVKDMSFAVIGSIGVRYLSDFNESHDEIKTVGAFAFNLSYRF
ncbi:MAG: hypothetical protein K9G61_04770 [Bacteroidales bacterium]|nr:hypothetical protein [Bacteroidales bacterium]